MTGDVVLTEEVAVRMRNWCWQLAGFFAACNDRPDLQANADRLLSLGDELDKAIKRAEAEA